MTKEQLSQLASAIAVRQCALFAGAGLTSQSGGATWKELVEFLKKKFDYESPLQDSFRIMGNMCQKYGHETVYEVVANRLRDAKIDEPVLRLTRLPWFTVFTTNYDLAMEKALVENQTLIVRSIVTGREFALAGLQSELLCIKLMGSLDIPYNQLGSMVLTPGDLALASEERARIFDMLASHAANLSFLFVGYSFEDGVFLDMIERLMKTIGKPKGTFYAVFRGEPDEEKAYLLSEYGIETIVSDLPKFIEELSDKVALLNPEDFTLKRIPVGSDVVPVDSTNIKNFLSLHNPMLYENLQEEVSPDSFLRGRTDSLKPFGLKWHYPRGEIEDVVNAVLGKEDGCPRFVMVRGNPGSGRTFTILAAVHELVTNHRSVGIKISPSSPSTSQIPTLEDMNQFMKELDRGSAEVKVSPPERVVLWATFTPEVNTISQFRSLSLECEYDMTFLLEDVKLPTLTDSLFHDNETVFMDVDNELSSEERERIAEYVLETVRTHKLPEITKEESSKIIAEEKTFLPIMYRTLDEARRSIDRIVQEEFNSLEDPEVKGCVSLCSLSSSLDLEMPLAVLKKALSEEVGKHLSYPEMYDIIKDNGKAFLVDSEDLRTNPLIAVYHSVIARRILALAGTQKVASHLMSIAQTASLRSPVEAEFVSNLFITKGVNWSPVHYRPFDNDTLEHALSALKHRQPARPIIHHLARLQSRLDRSGDQVISLLEEALVEPTEYYALTERKENVLTTLAKKKWEHGKEEMLSMNRSDPMIQEIIDLLILAREGSVHNIHPYDVHARILRELWHGKDLEDRMPMINEAVEVLNEGLGYCVGDPESTQRLTEIMIESLSEIDRKLAEESAKELLANENDGTGYYTLARIQYHEESNPTKANVYLDKAFKAKNVPPGAIAMRIEIYLLDKYPNYDKLLYLVDLLSSDPRFRDTWRSAYDKAVVYVINGRFDDAANLFKVSMRMAPSTLQRQVEVFWMEDGRRKTHTGKVGSILTEREGRVYSHGIEGWKPDIFFNPQRQDEKTNLSPGMFVDFELGFSPRGPIAFDVRPHQRYKRG
ncbi:MAG: SIR2 family protein [Candidatus Thorarchaeota archaeon]